MVPQSRGPKAAADRHRWAARRHPLDLRRVFQGRGGMRRGACASIGRCVSPRTDRNRHDSADDRATPRSIPPSSGRRPRFSPRRRPTGTGSASSRPTAPSPASTCSSATSWTGWTASAKPRWCTTCAASSCRTAAGALLRGPRQHLGHHQGLLRHEGRRRGGRRPGDGGGARPHPRGGGPVEADVFTKILLALFGEYDWRGVPGHAGRDHAAAPLVLLQPARGLVLVAHGHRAAPHPHGLQAREAAAATPAGSTSSGRCRASGRASGSSGSRVRSLPSTSSGRTSSSGWTTASRAGSGWARDPFARAPSRRRGAGSKSGWPCRADSAASSRP